MRGKRHSLALVVLLVFGLFVSSAEATTYYVNNQSPESSDVNPGTEALPWLTIQHAADMVSAGDAVLVKAGIYNESVKIATGGAEAAPVVFKGEPGAVLDGTGLSWSDYAAFVTLVWNPDYGYYTFSSADFVNIEGFEIRNFSRGIYVHGLWDYQTGQQSGGDGWAIKDNTIHDCTNDGISMWGGSVEGPNVVTGNILYGNFRDIHIHRNSIVERNVTLSHSYYESIRSCNAYYDPGAVHKVNNNTVINGEYGIMVSYPGSEYRNNIIMNIQPYVWTYGQDTYQRGGFAFRFYPSSRLDDLALVDISYNDVYNIYDIVGDGYMYSSPNYNFNSYTSYELPPSAVGNISADPLFISYTGDHTGDYHLTAYSPARDAGDPADPAPPGGGSRIDIGAYEYAALDIPSLVVDKHEFYDAGLIDNEGILNALDAKLDAAQAALVRGQTKTASNILNALINQAEAQAGKHIDKGAAYSLIEDAEMILEEIALVEGGKSNRK